MKWLMLAATALVVFGVLGAATYFRQLEDKAARRRKWEMRE